MTSGKRSHNKRAETGNGSLLFEALDDGQAGQEQDFREPWRRTASRAAFSERAAGAVSDAATAMLRARRTVAPRSGRMIAALVSSSNQSVADSAAYGGGRPSYALNGRGRRRTRWSITQASTVRIGRALRATYALPSACLRCGMSERAARCATGFRFPGPKRRAE